jgi:glutamine synthetase
MRSVDERPVAEGGSGQNARPLLAADRGGFIDRHDLWSPAQYAAAAQLKRVVDELGLELIRICFADQHGVLHGKTLTRAALSAALRSGVTAPSSLLLKDTSGRSAFPVFTADTGVGVAGFSGAGDIVLVPDPTTFRVLPWAPKTGWLLCDLRFPDGSPVPFCGRSLLRRQLGRLAEAGYAMTVGVELEFHVFRAAESELTADRTGLPGAPGRAPLVSPISTGSQLLHEEGLDRVDDLVQTFQRGLHDLDLPLRTLELEFGPNQLELTLQASDAAQAADDVILTRTAIRQLARRGGYHATFMSRPAGAATASAGWHLHQSLRDVHTGEPVFDHGETWKSYLGGLLAHARAAAAFTTPTVNGYKRYRAYSLAPDRVCWGADNKGAMVRVVGSAHDSGVRLENRSGEPAANPYFYIASQIVSGLDGLRRGLDPGPPVTDPYAADADPLPGSLAEAVDALVADPVFAEALTPEVIAWYAHLKRDEFARYLAHVSDWEQREYFDIF